MARQRRNDDGIDWEEMFRFFRHASWWAGPVAVGLVLMLFFLVIPLLIAAIGATSEQCKSTLAVASSS